MNKLIDLSLPLNENSPVYPGDPKVKIEPFLTIEKDGCNVHTLTFGTHVGTHIDASSHMVADGKNINEFPLEKFTGKGVCIDVSNGFDIAKIRELKVQKDDIILFYSGWDSHVNKADYYTNHPEIPIDIAEYLVLSQVKMIGIDFPSLDHEPYPVHKILLKNEIIIIESLTNLKELVEKKFTVFAFPLNVGVDGSPVRVLADQY